MLKKFSLFISLGLLLAGCQSSIQQLQNISQDIGQKVEQEKQVQQDRPEAIVKCQELCQNILFSDGQDFDRGPCLSNSIVTGWVCDVVHDPRQEIDNQLENQCDAFRQGTATHFVEIDGNCNLIKAQ